MGNAGYLPGKAGALSLLILLSAAAARADCIDPRDLDIPLGDRAFVQERHLPGFPQPILSSGIAELRSESVVWHLLEPFDVWIELSDEGVRRRVGGRWLDTPGADGFRLQAFGFRDILQGRFDRLGDRYELTWPRHETGAGWQVTLTPRHARLAELLGDVVVAGCRTIDAIHLRRAGGEKSVIRFTAPAADGSRARRDD